MRQLPLALALLAALLGLGAPLSRAQPAAEEQRVFLPLAAGRPVTPGAIGVDLRVGAGDGALPYLADLAPRWVRAGDLLWAEVEPVRGGSYRWEAAAGLEANIRRIRAAGAEPIVVIQWSPPWAQRVPGRLCSPPAPAYLADLARFAGAAAARYAAGPLAVSRWQLWNEADFRPEQIGESGSGCWGTGAAPYYGGDYYGQALRQVSPAIKAASPGAQVLAGGLAHFWPGEMQTVGFLRGMLAAGGASFDALSFSAYGTYQSADRVVYKANSLRRELAAFGLAGVPLFAAEVGAVCFANDACQPEFRQHQADYASRIAAEVLALGLEGAVWHTLVSPEPGFQHSHLLAEGDAPLPWPAYYALRNAGRLLRDARPAGPPPRELDESQAEAVQELVFATERGELRVLWLARTGATRQHALPVLPGAAASCTTRLEQLVPSVADCSDSDGDGRIALQVGSAATYVEVRP